MTHAFFLPAFMSNHNCSNGTVKILAQAQSFTRCLFKSVPVAGRYRVALQMHLNTLTPRLLPFWMISGAICLCFDWGWAHVSWQNLGQKERERERKSQPWIYFLLLWRHCWVCVVEAEEEMGKHNEFFCREILWGIFTQVPAKCSLKCSGKLPSVVLRRCVQV